MTMEKLSTMTMNEIFIYINKLESTRPYRRHVSLEEDGRVYPRNTPRKGKYERGISYVPSKEKYVVYYNRPKINSENGQRCWEHIYVGYADTFGDAQTIKSSCRNSEARTWWNKEAF